MFEFSSILRNQVPPRHVFAFYVGIPLGLAYLFGLNHVGMARHFSIGLALLYWIGVFLPFWWVLDLCSRLTAVALRALSLPWWAILFGGSVIAIVVFTPYVQWHAGLYAPALPEGQTYVPPSSIWSALAEWRSLVSFTAVPLVWISVNWFYDRIIDIPRFRGSVLEVADEDAAGSQEEPETTSKFLKAIPERLGSKIFALQAEDHYVRVFTDKGSGLVRYTLRDAVSELRHIDGLQVHRSFWVARGAVQDVHIDGSRVTLELPNGVKIPVSRAFREAAKLAGVLPS